MEFKKFFPIMVFDNQCYLCVKFAKVVDFFAKDKITMIGHHTKLGIEIREKILDESALDMFWFINNKTAYGGRAGLFPLIKTIFSKQTKKVPIVENNGKCFQDCKTIKTVFLRSASLIKNSKTLKV